MVFVAKVSRNSCLWHSTSVCTCTCHLCTRHTCGGHVH